MKKHITYIVAVIVSVISAGSCRQVSVEEAVQTGYLYVSLDRDDSEDLVFKSSPAGDIAFSLKVYNLLDQLVATVPDYRELAAEPLQLNVGEYTVVASSAEASASAAFDAPFYSGSANFNVLPDQVSNIDIVCSLANVKVTTVFSEEIKAGFRKYQLTVSNGQAALIFSSEDGTVDKEGYFSPTGTLTWSLYLENNDGQKYTALTETYTDVKARQHYNLSFSIEEKEDFGGGAIKVIVDNSLSEKEYDMTLDFGDETIPEISADFEYSDEPIELNAGDNTSKVLSFTSEDGFRNLFINYTSPVSTFSASSASVQVDLVGASQMTISDLAAAGIIAESVEYGAKSATVDFTSYIASLPIGNAGIAVLAADVNGAYSELNLNFVLRSPVETEAVSADPWATFVTLKGKWFTNSEPSGISFQYRKESDSSWSDFAGQVSADGASRTYTAKLTGLEPETGYVFRAVSAKDKETKEIQFTTESAGTIHNLNFDNWYEDGSTWMPNLDSSYQIWDSANPGSGGFGIIPTTPESSDVAVSGEGKNAARLELTGECRSPPGLWHSRVITSTSRKR